jgi:nitrate reductase gamma subunit
MIWVQYVSYASLLIAAIAMIAKALRYATAPTHFRWELYPVPHEKGRAEYGGSYLEELDWWSKPRHSDKIKELKEMMGEILFLKGVRHHNKKVWTFSFPFHFGLYLCIGWLALLLIGSILELAGVAISGGAGLISIIMHYLTILCGYAGLILSGVGAFGLLIWRITDSNQRPYNAPVEYLNLVLFDIVVALTLASHLSLDPVFSGLRSYIGSLVTFSSFEMPGVLFTLEIVVISFMIMYIPLTRMSHFVAKYFLYHAVRWNDEPNFRGSKIEASILKMLQHKVEWNAPHVQTGKSWAEVVKEKNNE